MESSFLTTDETAELLHVTPGTLAAWRSCKKKGPRYAKVGRSVWYDPKDIDAWIESQKIDPGQKPETIKKKPEKMAERLRATLAPCRAHKQKQPP